MWSKGVADLGDVAIFAEKSIAERGDVGIFAILPNEVKERILQDLDEFNELKFREIAAPGSNNVMDITEEMGSLLNLMTAAGLWPAN